MSIFKTYKKILCICLLIFTQNLQARDEFEKLGDILTLAPFGVLIVSLGMRDYEGAAQLAAGSLATQGTIELIKRFDTCAIWRVNR